MKKIKFIHFSHLRNEAHYEFLWIFNHLLDEFPAVKTLIAALYASFAALLDLEKKLLDAARASMLTQQLAEADHRVDRAVSGIKATINAARHSLDPAVAEAARVLYIRLREFGDIRGKAYEEETAAVQVLLHDFATTLVPQVSLVGLHAWVQELTEAENAFTQLYLQRGSETATRPTERMVDVRRDIEAKYNDMTTLIDAAAILAPADYDEFIAKLNVQVQYFNEHNHHHARKDLGAADHCVIEPIDTQKFTDRPITVVPDVHFREDGKETKRLYLGKDFSVTYKNNVKIGMAELTIHGKGEYSGQKTVTFNIAR
jgi:hypothetical protein